MADRHGDGSDIFAHKEAFEGADLEKQVAHRKDIGTMVEFASVALFGGHIKDLAFGHTRLGLVFLDTTFCDSKIGEFDFAFATQKDVIGAEIAVNEVKGLPIGIVGGVGVLESFEDLTNDVNADGKGKRDL